MGVCEFYSKTFKISNIIGGYYRMGITNYRIDKIEGEAKNRGADTVDVKESFSIKEVKKTTTQMLDVNWDFKVNYKSIGSLSMEGTLTYFTKDLADKYEEKTHEGKKVLALKGEAMSEVSNFVLRRGIIEAILLSKTLQLPAPIQLPKVKVEKKG